MKMTIRSALAFGFALVTTMMPACGGKIDPAEQLNGGQAGLGGKDDTQSSAPTPTKDPGTSAPKPENAGCFGIVEGSDSSCKSASDWKLAASDLCAAKGATLTNLGLGEACGGDGYRYAKIECCSAPYPPKDPSPDPGKDPAACTGHYLDGLCQGAAAWKLTASDACTKDGLSLGDIGFGASCGADGEIAEIKFTCCK